MPEITPLLYLCAQLWRLGWQISAWFITRLNPPIPVILTCNQKFALLRLPVSVLGTVLTTDDYTDIHFKPHLRGGERLV